MTKWITTLLLASLLWLAHGVTMAAELLVPEQFDVLMVNGKEYPATLSRTKTLTLNAGRNVVIIEFDQIYDADFGDSHDRVRSAPFALVFSVAGTDQLQLTGPELTNGADAKRYANAPTVQLVNGQTQTIAVQQLPVSDVNGLLIADNTGSSQVPPPPPMLLSDVAGGKPHVAPSPGAAPTATAVTAPDALQMLRHWWHQATPEQRAEFLRAITR